jgi:predicted O-methyltransferase YrrM
MTFYLTFYLETNMVQKVIVLNRKEVDSLPLDMLTQYISFSQEHVKFFLAPSGKEVYKLLASVSKQLDIGTVVSDIGTYIGSSALALSFNDGIKVHTYDPVSHIPSAQHVSTILSRMNIKRTVVSGQALISKIAESMVVFLDIDPHDGIEETKIMNKLIDLGFKGLLIVDNINCNKRMKHFWETVPKDMKKIDVTHIGHWIGTGIIVYDPNVIDVIVEDS